MLNFIKNNVNHFILIVFLYSTLYCYEKLYTIFSLFMRMGFIGRYTLYLSFSCPKFQLLIKSPEVTIFEKQCLTKIMKGMR